MKSEILPMLNKVIFEIESNSDVEVLVAVKKKVLTYPNSLCPKFIKRHLVHRYCKNIIKKTGIMSTPMKTGIFVFVSSTERSAHVFADNKILENNGNDYSEKLLKNILANFDPSDIDTSLTQIFNDEKKHLIKNNPKTHDKNYVIDQTITE